MHTAAQFGSLIEIGAAFFQIHRTGNGSEVDITRVEPGVRKCLEGSVTARRRADDVSKARKLFTDPSLRTADVAMAISYEPPSTFAARFRRAVGMPLREFRMRH